MLCGVSVDDKGVLQFHGGDFGKSTVGRENKPLLRVPVYSKRGDVLEVQAAHCCGASAIPGGGCNVEDTELVSVVGSLGGRRSHISLHEQESVLPP